MSGIRVKKTYKFKLQPNEFQKTQLDKMIKGYRFSWNAMVRERKYIYRLYINDLEKARVYKYKTTTEYRKEFPWLKDTCYDMLFYIQSYLDKKYEWIYKRKKEGQKIEHPKLKLKRQGKEFELYNYQNKIKINFENKEIRIPKIVNPVPYLGDEVFEDKIRKINVVKNGEEYSVLILTDGRTKIVKKATDKTTPDEIACNFLVYKFKLLPDNETKIKFDQFIDSYNLLLNLITDELIDAYHQFKGKPKKFQNHKFKTLEEYKKQYPSLNIIAHYINSHLKATINKLRTAVSNSLNSNKEIDLSKFKSKQEEKIFGAVNSPPAYTDFKIDFKNKELNMRKFGIIVPYKDDRVFYGKITSLIISKTDNGEYYASINTDKETGEENVLESDKVIGFKKLYADLLVTSEIPVADDNKLLPKLAHQSLTDQASEFKNEHWFIKTNKLKLAFQHNNKQLSVDDGKLYVIADIITDEIKTKLQNYISKLPIKTTSLNKGRLKRKILLVSDISEWCDAAYLKMNPTQYTHKSTIRKILYYNGDKVRVNEEAWKYMYGTINQIIETQVQEIINNVPKNKHGDCIEDRIEYEHFLEPPSLH